MKIIVITESQYSRLFLNEQQQYFSIPSGRDLYPSYQAVKHYEKPVTDTVKKIKSFLYEYRHELIDALAIAVLVIPVAGVFISAAIELGHAYLYYKEGDKFMAGFTAILAVVPAGIIAKKMFVKAGIMKQIDNVTAWLLKQSDSGVKVSQEALEKKLKQELGETAIENNKKLIVNWFEEVLPKMGTQQSVKFANQLQKLISKTQGFWKDFVSNEKVFKKLMSLNGDSVYKSYVAYLRGISMKESFWGSAIYAMLMYFGEEITTFVFDNNVLYAKDAIVAWKKRNLKKDAKAGNISSIVKNDGYPWEETKEIFKSDSSIEDNELLKKAWKAGWRPDDEKYVPEEFRTKKYKEWLETQEGFDGFNIMKDQDIDLYDFDPEDVPGIGDDYEEFEDNMLNHLQNKNLKMSTPDSQKLSDKFQDILNSTEK